MSLDVVVAEGLFDREATVNRLVDLEQIVGAIALDEPDALVRIDLEIGPSGTVGISYPTVVHDDVPQGIDRVKDCTRSW